MPTPQTSSAAHPQIAYTARADGPVPTGDATHACPFQRKTPCAPPAQTSSVVSPHSVYTDGMGDGTADQVPSPRKRRIVPAALTVQTSSAPIPNAWVNLSPVGNGCVQHQPSLVHNPG